MYTSNGFETGRRIIQKSKSQLLSSIQTGEVPVLPVIKRGRGPYLYDYDTNRYVDFFLSRGALVLGHAHPGVTSVMKSWINRGYAGGYPTVSHGMLASRAKSVLLTNGNLRNHTGSLLFFNSSYDACMMLLEIIRVLGMKGVYVFDGDENKSPLLWRAGLTSIRIEDVDAQTLRSIDCLILRFSRRVSGSDALDLLGKAKSLKKIVITDETELSSFIHASALNEAGGIDIRIFGAWLSGGIEFGAVYAEEDAALNLTEALGKITAILPVIAFPALYKIKAAVRFLKLVETAGGFTVLKERHERFGSMLEQSFFETVDGLSYISAEKSPSEKYQEFHAQLLRHGMLFPAVRTDPLFVSFAHNEELLKKSAAQINTIIAHFSNESL